MSNDEFMDKLYTLMDIREDNPDIDDLFVKVVDPMIEDQCEKMEEKFSRIISFGASCQN